MPNLSEVHQMPIQEQPPLLSPLPAKMTRKASAVLLGGPAENGTVKENHILGLKKGELEKAVLEEKKRKQHHEAVSRRVLLCTFSVTQPLGFSSVLEVSMSVITRNTTFPHAKRTTCSCLSAILVPQGSMTLSNSMAPKAQSLLLGSRKGSLPSGIDDVLRKALDASPTAQRGTLATIRRCSAPSASDMKVISSTGMSQKQLKQHQSAEVQRSFYCTPPFFFNRITTVPKRAYERLA